jgi:periplasmic nitrate reductase NapD
MQQHVRRGANCGNAGSERSHPAEPTADVALYHVAGILVYTALAREDEVRSAIEALTGALVHARVNGHIVVTLEGRVSSDIVDVLNTIQCMPGVLSALLVSEHSEPIETIDEEIPNER